MSEPMYDASRSCPKCGNNVIVTTVQTFMWLMPWRGPRMERHCGRCDYRWLELPLDHNPEAEDAAFRAWGNHLREKAPA